MMRDDYIAALEIEPHYKTYHFFKMMFAFGYPDADQFSSLRLTLTSFSLSLLFNLLCFSCSVACYKTHQDNCQPTAPEEDPARDLGGQSSLIYTEDEAVVVPQEHLERLAHSAELKRVLANPELRRFLTFINTTHNPKGFMNLAMQEPLFLEFANICLKVLHPELNEVDELSLEQVQEIVQETIEQAQEDA